MSKIISCYGEGMTGQPLLQRMRFINTLMLIDMEFKSEKKCNKPGIKPMGRRGSI